MQGAVAIQVVPITDVDDITSRVDKVIHYIESTGLSYEVGPFETTVEGDFDELMDLVKKCNQIMVDEDLDGFMCYTKFSFMKDAERWTSEEKTKKFRK